MRLYCTSDNNNVEYVNMRWKQRYLLFSIDVWKQETPMYLDRIATLFENYVDH